MRKFYSKIKSFFTDDSRKIKKNDLHSFVCLWDNKNVVFFRLKNVGKPTFLF